MQKRIINAIIIIVCFIACLSSTLYTSWCYKQDIYNSNLSYIQDNYSCVAGINNEISNILNQYGIAKAEIDTDLIESIIYTTTVAENINVEVIEETVEESTINEDELDLLAHLIYSEVGILGEEAMYLCGCVVLNRTNSDVWKTYTIYDTIYAKGQWAVTWDGGINKIPTQEAYDIAERLLIEGSGVPNIYYAAQFKQGTFTYKKIGNTYFCG